MSGLPYDPNQYDYDYIYAYFTANKKGKTAIQMAARGMTNEQISTAINEAFEEQHRRHQGFKDALEEELERLSQRFSVDDRVKELLPKAFNRLQTILQDDSQKTTDHIKVAELIGNWAGVGKGVDPKDVNVESLIKQYANEKYS